MKSLVLKLIAIAMMAPVIQSKAAVIYTEGFDDDAFGVIHSDGTYPFTAPLSNSSMSGYIPSAGAFGNDWLMEVKAGVDGRGGNVAQFGNANVGSSLFATSGIATIVANTEYTLQLDLNATNWAGPARDWDMTFGFYTGSISSPTILEASTVGGQGLTSWAGWQTVAVSFNSGVLNTGESLNFFVTRGNNTSALIYEYVDNVVVTAVPEPSALALLGLGGFALLRRRRR